MCDTLCLEMMFLRMHAGLDAAILLYISVLGSAASYGEPTFASLWCGQLLHGIRSGHMQNWHCVCLHAADVLRGLAEVLGLSRCNPPYCAGVFFYNASRGNLTALSSLTFLTPMFAALAGYIVLGEVLSPIQLTGAGVTLGAVTLLNSKSSQAEKI